MPHYLRRIWSICVVLFCVSSGLPAAWSQEEEREIETDRDSFTPATTLVAPSRWIVEGSYSFIDNRDTLDTHSYPELLTRYGVNDWLELRLGWNYEVGGGGDVSGSVSGARPEFGEEREELGKISYGFKTRLSEQEEWLPESAFILSGTTPTSGEETATRFVGTYVWGWTLPNEWVWDSSIRFATVGGEDAFNSWAPSSVIKVPVAENWMVHAEYFGIFSDGLEEENASHFFSPGAHYLITPNLEVGVRVGWGLTDRSANFFSNVGVGWMY